MPIDQAMKIISYCRSLGGEYITFLGGEPTLHRKLPQMVDFALEAGYSQVMINSNGIAERPLYEIAPNKLHYISFSLDGASQETHEKIRGTGTYSRTLSSIKKTVEAGYDVRIICTISQVNIHEAKALLEMCDDLGIKMLNFHVFSEEGLGVGKSDWSLTPDEWIDFYEYLEEIKDGYMTSIWYPPTYATRARLDRYVEEGYRGCVGASLDRLSVFPDGRCYVCSVLFDVPLHFANMTDKGLELNRGRNEFELFTASLFEAEQPWLSGCPAEQVLDTQGKKRTPGNLTSICRLWKSQA